MLKHRLRALLTLGFIFLVISFCDDLEGSLEEVDDLPAGTAPIWAKPYWAKVVWETPGSGICAGGQFTFIESGKTYCGACPAAYTWLGTGGPDFCYRCDPGFIFDRFPDDDFCYECPPGTALMQSSNGRYTCLP